MNIQINLDSFKGQGKDPNKWFTYFERWAAFMNMNGDRAAMALPITSGALPKRGLIHYQKPPRLI